MLTMALFSSVFRQLFESFAHFWCVRETPQTVHPWAAHELEKPANESEAFDFTANDRKRRKRRLKEKREVKNEGKINKGGSHKDEAEMDKEALSLENIKMKKNGHVHLKKTKRQSLGRSMEEGSEVKEATKKKRKRKEPMPLLVEVKPLQSPVRSSFLNSIEEEELPVLPSASEHLALSRPTPAPDELLSLRRSSSQVRLPPSSTPAPDKLFAQRRPPSCKPVLFPSSSFESPPLLTLIDIEDEETEYVEYTGKIFRISGLHKSERPQTPEPGKNPRKLVACLEKESEVQEEAGLSEVVEIQGYEEEENDPSKTGDSKAIQGHASPGSPKNESQERCKRNVPLVLLAWAEEKAKKKEMKKMQKEKQQREKESLLDHCGNHPKLLAVPPRPTPAPDELFSLRHSSSQVRFPSGSTPAPNELFAQQRPPSRKPELFTSSSFESPPLLMLIDIEDEETEYVEYTGKTFRISDLHKSERPQTPEPGKNPRKVIPYLEKESEVQEEAGLSEVVEIQGYEEEENYPRKMGDSKAIQGHASPGSPKNESQERWKRNVPLVLLTWAEEKAKKKEMKKMQKEKQQRGKESLLDHCENHPKLLAVPPRPTPAPDELFSLRHSSSQVRFPSSSTPAPNELFAQQRPPSRKPELFTSSSFESPPLLTLIDIEDEETEYVEYTGKTFRISDLHKSERPQTPEPGKNPRKVIPYLEKESEVQEEAGEEKAKKKEMKKMQKEKKRREKESLHERCRNHPKPKHLWISKLLRMKSFFQ